MPLTAVILTYKIGEDPEYKKTLKGKPLINWTLANVELERADIDLHSLLITEN